MKTDSHLSFPRNGRIAKGSIVALVLGAVVFLGFMAVLATHDSALWCDTTQCVHVERYPLGVVQRRDLPRVKSADTEWDPGGRVRAIKLVLEHENGTFTEYQGVGANGERAQRVAKELNAFLAHPGGERTFPLREGSVVLAAFLVVMSALMGLLVPYVFSNVRLSKSANGIQVSVGRWPVPPRRHTLPTAEIQGFRLQRKAVVDQTLFTVCIERSGGATIDIGLGFRNLAQAEQRVAELNAWIARPA